MALTDARTGVPVLLGSFDELEAVAIEWNELAMRVGNPFLSTDWLISWWDHFGTGSPVVIVLKDGEGRMTGGAFCHRTRFRIESPANLGSMHGHWDVLARSDDARRDVWRALARLAPGRLYLAGLLEDTRETDIARETLAGEGFEIYRRGGSPCPYLLLPDCWETLLAGVSRNLRSQVGRRERALQKVGELRFRTVTGGPEMPSALEHMFRLEASGWKARKGSAILNDPAVEGLYRSFASRASERGWLRLYLLELDGEPIAADLGGAFGRTGLLIKTGFDEDHGRLSPGLVLRAKVLQASIEEGLELYDFLAGAQPYKLRWGAQIRHRVKLQAYRGAGTAPERFYERNIRPPLRQVALTALSERRRAPRRDTELESDPDGAGGRRVGVPS